MKLSQAKFATLMGIRVWTLRAWERGRYEPEYADLILEALTARAKRAGKAGGGR